jgi:hypothetical protein
MVVLRTGDVRLQMRDDRRTVPGPVLKQFRVHGVRHPPHSRDVSTLGSRNELERQQMAS